jgi:hypothetical protein
MWSEDGCFGFLITKGIFQGEGTRPAGMPTGHATDFGVSVRLRGVNGQQGTPF